MVKVLASGEIVPDDDPRATSNTNRPPVPTQGTQPNRRQGAVNHGEHDGNEPMPHGPSVSIFDTLNARLAGMGVPTWNLGPYAVEPIASAGFLISLLLFGFRGLVFSGLLFFIVKYSQIGTGNGRRFNLPSWTGLQEQQPGQDRSNPGRHGTQDRSNLGRSNGARTPPGGGFTGSGHRLGNS